MLSALLTGCTASVLEASAAESIRAGRVHQESFAPPLLVNHLRADCAALDDEGYFQSAGSGGRAGAVDTMRSALYCDPVGRDRSVGMWDAFFALWERLDAVRQELAVSLGLPLLEDMELHYVDYQRGGYYQRHVDDDLQAAGAPSRRCVSFVLFLTPADEPWEASDGGALRAYQADGVSQDHLPTSGSLALFDSCRVEHEVLPTTRSGRLCLIGWFHTTA